METVLITGGSGLIGMNLSALLSQNGYEVRHLTRKPNPSSAYPGFFWNPSDGTIDPLALEGVHTIIHLAGSGIVDKRWSRSRKRELVDSRVNSLGLIARALPENNRVKTVISASGVGYYGAVTSNVVFSEDYPPGKDFISHCCVQWESALKPFKDLGIRTVSLRTSVVLSDNGGALKRLKGVVNNYIGPVLGSGLQFFPWVHIEDVCYAYLHALRTESMKGVYNLSVCDDTTQKSFIQKLAAILGKKILLPAVPSFAFRTLLGEMAVILLEGSRVSSDKLKATGFDFRFENLEEALADCLNKPGR